jgi:hypothetical protein
MSIKILKSDGTELAHDVPEACVSEMSDPNVAREAIADWLNVAGACKLIFDIGLEGAPTEPVRRDADRMAAIAGATDYLLYGKYDHPMTAQGLHLYADADVNAQSSGNLGFVRSTYTGNVVPAPKMKDGQHVWHVIGRQLDNFITDPAKVQNAIAKHVWIEYMLMGNNLSVWIAPIRNQVSTFLVQWFMEDRSAAKSFGEQRQAAARLNRTEVRPAGSQAWKSLQSAIQVGDAVELPSEINVPTIDGEVINLMELVDETGIKLYKNGGYITKQTFKPNDPQSVLTFQNLFGVDSKYAVKVLD